MSAHKLDMRLNAVRDDIIDASLADFAEGRTLVAREQAQIIEPVVSLKSSPRFDASIDTQVLYGETVRVFDEAEGWSWVQLERDGYVGYISSDSYVRDIVVPTHWVQVLRTFVYPAPDIKTPPIRVLHMNSSLSVVDVLEKFVEIAGGGFVYASHVSGLEERSSDFVEVASRFVGTPYLWGGKSSEGIDCSGLVQMSLWATGADVPRDSDMLEGEVGEVIGEDTGTVSLQSGDLVFWKGHVGIMKDAETLIHANGYHMLTVEEPVAEAVKRIADMYGVVTSVKRL